MKNFVYQNRTKILFGEDKLSLIGDETTLFGRKVLLVTGCQHLRASGYYDTIKSSLSDSGAEVLELSGISTNPSLKLVREGINICKNQKVEVLCAAGGGSVIDTAKAIGAGSVVNHDVWKFFIGKKGVKSTLPLTCVSTLAGSGSDMNSGMVLTNEEKKQKIGIANKNLFPKVSILNPNCTLSTPADLTAFGAIDIISHLLEVYFTHSCQTAFIQDSLMEGLLLSTIESCNAVLADPTNYNHRANLMWAGSLALSGLTTAGVGKVGFTMHLIEHSVSALFDIPHGKGLAAIIPGWLKTQHIANPIRMEKLNLTLKNSKSSLTNTDSDSVEFFHNWFQYLDCPTNLGELGITRQDIPHLVDNCLPLAKIWRMREFTQEKIEDLFLSCL